MTTLFLTIIDFKTLLFFSYRSYEQLIQRNAILSATPNLFFLDSGVQHPPWREDGKHTQTSYKSYTIKHKENPFHFTI